MPRSGRGLGRWYARDARDDRFPLRKAIPLRVPKRTIAWRPGPVLDQGNSSMCVGYAWRSFLDASPLRTRSGPSAKQIYDEAQARDEWPGADYEGTSVRAGVKALVDRGHVEQYLWGHTAEDARDFVLSRGSLVFGTYWSDDMFNLDKRGFVRPTKPTDEGHAFLVFGYSVEQRAFRAQSSWGADWGDEGRFWLGFTDAQRLIKADGEVVSAIEVAA